MTPHREEIVVVQSNSFVSVVYMYMYIRSICLLEILRCALVVFLVLFVLCDFIPNRRTAARFCTILYEEKTLMFCITLLLADVHDFGPGVLLVSI